MQAVEDQQGDRQAGQVDLVARRGDAPRPLPDAGRDPFQGRLWRQTARRSPSIPHRRRLRQSCACQRRHRAANHRGTCLDQLQVPEPAGRNGDDQHARPARALAGARVTARMPISWRASSTSLRTGSGRIRYKFRRSLLAHRADFVHVLDTLAEKGDWGKPMPAGKGRGIAIHECYGSIVGTIAEVAVSPGRRGQGRAGGHCRRLRPHGQSRVQSRCSSKAP